MKFRAAVPIHTRDLHKFGTSTVGGPELVSIRLPRPAPLATNISLPHG